MGRSRGVVVEVRREEMGLDEEKLVHVEDINLLQNVLSVFHPLIEADEDVNNNNNMNEPIIYITGRNAQLYRQDANRTFSELVGLFDSIDVKATPVTYSYEGEQDVLPLIIHGRC